MTAKKIKKHLVSNTLCSADYLSEVEWQSAIIAGRQGKLEQAALHDLAHSLQLNQLQAQVKSGAFILTLGHFNYFCPMQDWQYLLNLEKCNFNEYLNQAQKKSYQPSRWFSSQAYFSVVELKEPDLNLDLNQHSLWLEKIKWIRQAQKIYPNYLMKYAIPGPLTYLWFNNYLGQSKILTPEKLNLLPKLINQYKIIIQALKNLNINWVQLEDPVFIIDISAEFQDKIIQAYQGLLDNAPNIMLATYFGGVDENIHWIKKIPFQGLHLDLDAAPEQIMFVLKNDIMKTLKVLSLEGMNPSDSHFDSIKEYLASVTNPNPDIWLSFRDKMKKNKSKNTLDIIQLYLDEHLDVTDNYPKILALKKRLTHLKAENPHVKLTLQSLLDLTCFMKKRDQESFINSIKILSEL